MKTIAQKLRIKEFPFEIKDKDGNIVYYEYSDGYWWRSEYKDGNVVYYEDSDGDWWRWEYKDGNEVYCENSNGFWIRREYKDGNVIYFEDSDGMVVDNRPKVEMTLAEICKELGKNIKIIK